MAEIRSTLTEIAGIQRQQSAVLLELTQRVIALLERWNGHPPEAPET